MVAVTGSIGESDTLNGDSTLNVNAIDLDVDVLAAMATGGIYVCETTALAVGTVAATTVNVDLINRANFNSTTTNTPQIRNLAALSGIESTGGVSKIVTKGGSLTITDSVAASGDVLLESRGPASDVIIDGSVQSVSGNIEFHAADDIDINASVQTGGTGTVYVRADNQTATDGLPTGIDGIDIDGTITTEQGDVFITAATASGNVRLNGNITTSGVFDGEGNVAIVTGDDILINANIQTASGSVLLSAANGTVEGDEITGVED